MLATAVLADTQVSICREISARSGGINLVNEAELLAALRIVIVSSSGRYSQA